MAFGCILASRIPNATRLLLQVFLKQSICVCTTFVFERFSY